MKISACMIAKNEEKVIARCIESYREAVDEIIVVDTGSTDQTVAIAQSLGAKVFYFQWIDDFSAAKNYALSKAKGDWIVFLDADEYFANGTGSNLRSFLQKLDKAFDGVACRMLNLDEVSGKITSEIIHIRIFKNDKRLSYTNPIHEELACRRKGAQLQVHMADRRKLIIHHTGYSDNISQEKARRNLALLLKQLNDDIASEPKYYYYIADTYFSLHEWDKVIRYIRLFMDTGFKLSNLNVRAHGILIDAMTRLNYPVSEIVPEVAVAVAKFPLQPFFRFYQAKFLYDDRRYDAALLEARQTRQLHETYEDIEMNLMPANLGSLYNMLGAISEFRGDYGASIGYYLEALKWDKYEATAFDRLIKLVRTQPLEEIVAFLNTVYDLDKEADLDFLATSLINQAVPQVLAYYTALREKKYPKQDYVVLQMLVANGHYDKAFAAILDCYTNDKDERLALIAATAAALSGKGDYMAQAVQQLPPAYGKILKAYQGGIMLFNEDDKAIFIKLVRVFILWADDEARQKLLALADQFPDGMAAAIGNLFLQEGHYQASLAYCNVAVQNSLAAGLLVHPVLYYNQGYCLHRLNNPIAAAEAFVKAYEAGYRANDIYEYLRWNVDKLGENGLDKKVKIILKGNSHES
ncbi:glycosyltransferase family 2 protein [Sporomusa sphaeroides]|uniref:glycosyltransferase family 2 protein n=1 Tax=Sporomusa sphaeroides TaxID=47679 RepID=UPI002C996943|nr:glycosyltransferase family 2 protein [Sporomusa sphaeroides]HML34226.1 glycosyltransferase family 2 protein [Sporomusa sphaeroides]